MADGECDDEFERAFPGVTLTHVLSVVTADGVDLALEVLQAVRASGGRLEGLSVGPRGDAVDHQLRLGGLRPVEARRLSDHLAGLPGVRHSAVEHRLLGQARSGADAG